MFWFKLAIGLGCSVREAQQKISPDEFMDWIAYDRIQPIGPERADLLTGIQCATLANINRGRKQRAYRPKDFMPEYGTKIKTMMSDEQIKKFFMAIPRSNK